MPAHGSALWYAGSTAHRCDLGPEVVVHRCGRLSTNIFGGETWFFQSTHRVPSTGRVTSIMQIWPGLFSLRANTQPETLQTSQSMGLGCRSEMQLACSPSMNPLSSSLSTSGRGNYYVVRSIVACKYSWEEGVPCRPSQGQTSDLLCRQRHDLAGMGPATPRRSQAG
jgi:hypothetical protein